MLLKKINSFWIKERERWGVEEGKHFNPKTHRLFPQTQSCKPGLSGPLYVYLVYNIFFNNYIHVFLLIYISRLIKINNKPILIYGFYVFFTKLRTKKKFFKNEILYTKSRAGPLSPTISLLVYSTFFNNYIHFVY